MKLNPFAKAKTKEDVVAIARIRKIYFFVVVGFLAFCFIGGEIGIEFLERWAFPICLVCVPLAILFGFMAFALNTKDQLESYKKSCCDCGEAVNYHDGVTYEMLPKRPRVTTSENKDNGNIKKYTHEDAIITYPCPKCGKVRKYEGSFITKVVETNKYGVVLSERKYTTQEEVKKFNPILCELIEKDKANTPQNEKNF